MGQTLTQTKQQVTPEAETFLLKYFPQFQFVKMLTADSIFLKSVLCTNENDGFPIVCKIYFKKEMNPAENNIYMRHVKSLREIKETYNNINSPNVAPILIVNDSLQKAGLIIRQYYSFNLKERMASMPYLTKIEKKWISFQILYGLSQIHNKGICHGNIKLENILLSSNMSVFLCDMAPYKPAYIQEDDVGSFTYYFGGSSSVNSCYLAPERLVDRQTLNDLTNSIYKITASMDVFSAGVVIAELFLEDILFDHAKLLQYKYNKYNLEPTLNKLKDEKLERLLLGMLTVDPAKRIDINNSLEYFAEEISPISFSRMFIHFNNLTINSQYWKPDKRIALVRVHWRQVWKSLFGVSSEAPELYQNLNHNVLNKVILDDPFQKGALNESGFKLIFNLESDCALSLLRENEEQRIAQAQNKESAYLMLNFILSVLLNTKYFSSKLCAMEMLKHLANNLPLERDLTKIQVIIPFLCKLFKDPSSLIRFSALHEVIEMLSDIDVESLILPSSDYNFFDAYVFPNILELYNSNEPALVLAFSSLIDKITDLEQKFLQISMKSRFLNMKKLRNMNQLLMQKSQQDFNKQAVYGFYSGLHGNSKGEEIILNYDQDLFEFKFTLFKIIEDILSKNEDIDIQRILIKKLPYLMIFTGRRETSTFTKFIISNFNRRDWIIHREIFQSFPSLVISLGEKDLNEFIIPCMDMIISNNLNELKIYEMIKSMHILLKMNYLETKTAIDLFKKILPYIIHANILIRNEVINFAASLIKNQTPAEIYTHLRPELKNFFSIPFLTITNDLLKNNIKDRLSRVIYEMNVKGIKYILQPNLEDKEAFALIEGIINLGKSSLNNVKSNENERTQFEKQILRLRGSLEGVNVANIVRKEFFKSIKNLNNYDDIKFYETIFLGKIISSSSIIDSLQIPINRNRRNSGQHMLHAINDKNFNLEQYQKEGIIFQDNFRVKFLLKLLDISVKDDTCFDEASIIRSQKSSISGSSSNLSQKNLHNSYLASWRPTGKLISTFYDHDQSSIEKLIHLPNDSGNKLVSVGGDGKLVLYDFYDSESNIFIDKVAETKAEYIQYNKAITAIDANSFAIGYKNKINVYSIENFNAPNQNQIVQSYSIPDDAAENVNIVNLACYLKNPESSQFNKTLVYTNQKGKISIYDLRCSKKVLSNNFGVCRGLFSSIDFGKDDKSVFISTFGGYILNYDFRLNHIVESYRLFDNVPIISLKTFTPPKQKEFEANLSLYTQANLGAGSANNLNNALNNSNLNNNNSNSNNNYGTNNNNYNNYFGNSSSNNVNNNLGNNLNSNSGSNFSSSFTNNYNNSSNLNSFAIQNNFANSNNSISYNNYVLISTATGEHDLSLWNLNTLSCEYLFKTNTIKGKEQKPLLTEIPSMSKITSRDFNKESYEGIYKNLTKLNTSRLYNNILKESIDSDFYLQSNKRLAKINNIYANYSSVQVICCPSNIRTSEANSSNASVRENVPFILSAGNDMSIRFWDIRKDKANNKSFVVNCPNKVDWVTYNTSCFDKTLVIQSDEYVNLESPKKNCPNFSEFQNKNGVGYHTAVQNEFVDNSGDFLQFCTSLSDASHKDFITDLQVMSLQKSDKTVLVSSSWDGAMKIWR